MAPRLRSSDRDHVCHSRSAGEEHRCRESHSTFIVIDLLLFILPWTSTISGARMPGFEARLYGMVAV